MREVTKSVSIEYVSQCCTVVFEGGEQREAAIESSINMISSTLWNGSHSAANAGLLHFHRKLTVVTNRAWMSLFEELSNIPEIYFREFLLPLHYHLTFKEALIYS